MPSDDHSVTPTRVLDVLGDVVEDPEDIAAMTQPQLREYLQAEGIDPDRRSADLKALLERVRGEDRLEQAAQRRKDAERLVKDLSARVSQSVEATRAYLMGRLLPLSSQKPAALAYFRQAETASDDDIRRMVEDLALLDLLQEADLDDVNT